MIVLCSSKYSGACGGAGGAIDAGGGGGGAGATSSTTVLRSWNIASEALRPRVRWLTVLRGGER
jgi:hypothetical protein